MSDKIHTAEKVAYSSIVGQGIMLLNETGACIAMLHVMNADDPQDIADQAVDALNTGLNRERILQELSDFGQEIDAQETDT